MQHTQLNYWCNNFNKTVFFYLFWTPVLLFFFQITFCVFACLYRTSHTTRGPYYGEEDGVDYHFVSEEEFLNSIHMVCQLKKKKKWLKSGCQRLNPKSDLPFFFDWDEQIHSHSFINPFLWAPLFPRALKSSLSKFDLIHSAAVIKIIIFELKLSYCRVPSLTAGIDLLGEEALKRERRMWGGDGEGGGRVWMGFNLSRIWPKWFKTACRRFIEV